MGGHPCKPSEKVEEWMDGSSTRTYSTPNLALEYFIQLLILSFNDGPTKE